MSGQWPPLPLDQWRPTMDTLHMWTQIVGKTSLALAPMQNHWWQVTLHVTPRGLATLPLPWENLTFDIEFDFLDHVLVVRGSNGERRTMSLSPRSVADFYQEYVSTLSSLDVHPHIRPVPVEVETAIPFAEDQVHAAYDAEAAQRHWRILLDADRVLRRFHGRFMGKASPVHFFWGSFDLAMTRFSGRPAPRHRGGAPNCPDHVMVEAYSRECASFGFWPGGGVMPEPAFYAYAYPEPGGFADAHARPAGASYARELGEFILPYEGVRSAADPDQLILDFFQSAYDAAADLGRWDRSLLDVPGAVDAETRSRA
jgi:hypothetical protein